MLLQGLHTIPEADYHADPAPAPSLSSTLARLILAKSPLHAWTAHPRLNPQEAAPRRGGVVYADPDPVIDEFLDADPNPATATDPEIEARLAAEHAAFLAEQEREAG